jgi:hypothetical protein
MNPVDENNVKSTDGVSDERIGVDVLNALDIGRRIDAVFVLALYAFEVLATSSNTNLQIASVLATANEAIDYFSSRHKPVNFEVTPLNTLSSSSFSASESPSKSSRSARF